MNPFVESNDIRHDADALRARADRDGYLFFRAFVAAEPILEARREIAATLQQAGWIDADTDPFEAITSHPALISGMEEHRPVYDSVQRLESFHALGHDTNLFAVISALLGPEVLLQPGNIARFIFPSKLEYTTPAHQDYVHIQGTPDVWTAWLPLGDCPRELGGLSLLPGSHKIGVLPVAKARGAGGLRSDTATIDTEWISSPFELGDVLFFHSHTVHQGLPNLSGNRLRLSVDYRYQKAYDPVMDRVLEPHQGRLSWEEVYRDWRSDTYQYYWKKTSLNPVAKQPWPVVKPMEEKD